MFNAERFAELIDDVAQTSIHRLRILQTNQPRYLLQGKSFLITQSDKQSIGVVQGCKGRGDVPVRFPQCR